jgi:dienelactone hydrolase
MGPKRTPTRSLSTKPNVIRVLLAAAGVSASAATLRLEPRSTLESAERLLIWGRQDPHVPLAGKIIYDALIEAGTNFQWNEFNGAHVFSRDEGPRYDSSASRLAFEITLELFQRRLTSPRITAGIETTAVSDHVTT